MKKIERGKRASENQKELLINYLETNLEIAKDKFVTAIDVKYRDEVWKELAIKLNAVNGGSKKDSGRWRKYWKDLKLNTCNKYNAIKGAETNSTLGRVRSLTCLEERILKLIIQIDYETERTPVDITTITETKSLAGFEEFIFEDNIEEDIKPSIEELSINNKSVANNVETTTSNTTKPENYPTTAAATVAATSQPRKLKRKAQTKATHLAKLRRIEEKKLSEMKKANNLKKEQIALLKEQTESIKTDARNKELLLQKLQNLIDILGKRI